MSAATVTHNTVCQDGSHHTAKIHASVNHNQPDKESGAKESVAEAETAAKKTGAKAVAKENKVEAVAKKDPEATQAQVQAAVETGLSFVDSDDIDLQENGIATVNVQVLKSGDSTSTPISFYVKEGNVDTLHAYTVETTETKDNEWKLILKHPSGKTKFLLEINHKTKVTPIGKSYVIFHAHGGQYFGKQHNEHYVFRLYPVKKAGSTVTKILGVVLEPLNDLKNRGYFDGEATRELHQIKALANQDLAPLVTKVERAFVTLYVNCHADIVSMAKEFKKNPASLGRHAKTFARHKTALLGVAFILPHFQVHFENKGSSFINTKRLKGIYNNLKHQYGACRINVGNDFSKMSYVVQIFKGFLLDEGYPIV